MKWNVGWGFTKLCNFNCSHCYNASGKRDDNELTLEEAKKVVDKLKEGGVESINYGTGECGLLPDFWKLVKYVHKKGITQGLTSNGSSVNKETIKIVKECMNDIDISVDYGTEREHNNFRRHDNAWGLANNALTLLQGYNVERSIITCITAQNSTPEHIAPILNLAKKYGATFRINWFRPTGRGKENSKFKLEVKQVNNMFRWLVKNTKVIALPDPYFSSLVGIKNNTQGCPCGKVSFRITPAGIVVPCVYFTKEFDNLNIKESSFNSVTNSPLFQKINNRIIKECKACKYYEKCRGGCASRAYLEHGSMNKPDAFCFKMHGIKENPFKDLKVELKPKKGMVHENYLCTMIMEPK